MFGGGVVSSFKESREGGKQGNRGSGPEVRADGGCLSAKVTQCCLKKRVRAMVRDRLHWTRMDPKEFPYQGAGSWI